MSPGGPIEVYIASEEASTTSDIDVAAAEDAGHQC